ncbi:hypothetical protein PHET_01451 [Paragonimus heterotremus]|uniref:Uncharacterized protein n=1 Tax=Paragonimus heterotremus TaxID=100268 RepID=A0A8J4TMW4_9TREM|nr:hypothetical protein PHET_01451 [Paragonimus heterotremus]
MSGEQIASTCLQHILNGWNSTSTEPGAKWLPICAGYVATERQTVCCGRQTSTNELATRDNAFLDSSTMNGVVPITWPAVTTRSAWTATGATLGIMALVLVFFLFILCLPWSKCSALRRCCNKNNSPANPERPADLFGLEAYTGGYPLSIVDIYPPSMLPKLPDYQECVQQGDPPPPDELPPTEAHPTVISEEHTITVEQPGTSRTLTIPLDATDCLEYNNGATRIPSTPPPNYSTLHSPCESGECAGSVRSFDRMDASAHGELKWGR